MFERELARICGLYSGLTVIFSQGPKDGGGDTMTVLGLVLEILGSCKVEDSFRRALDRVDGLAVSPAMQIRQSIAKLVASDLALLQRNFRRHSFGELATSQTLQSIASTLKPTSLREEMLAHADDELRHSKLFSALAKSLQQSTGYTDCEDFSWILDDDRRFVENYAGDIVEFICNVFAAEVRSHSFVTSYITALRADDSAQAKRICKVLARILDDEGRHIGYTGRYINQWMASNLDLAESLERSFKAFDRNSWVDIAGTAQFFYERA